MTDFATLFPQTPQHDAITEAAASAMLRELELQAALDVVHSAGCVPEAVLDLAHSAIWGRFDELLAAGLTNTGEFRVVRAAGVALAARVRLSRSVVGEGAHERSVESDALAAGFNEPEEGIDVCPGAIEKVGSPGGIVSLE
ncbi:MAG: hypothetical protein ACXVGG_13670 [Mycobacteriaceae bacterium]